MRRYHELEQRLAKDAASGLVQDPRIQLWLAELKLAEGDPVAAQAHLAQIPLDFSPIDSDMSDPVQRSALSARLRWGGADNCSCSREVGGCRF